jgi:multiple sugar transport system substrate-binding protein
MKRRTALLAAAASTLVAPSVRAQQKTITFRFNDPEAPQLRAALDEFERRNPNIKVTMQRVAWGDAQAQFLREAAVGTAPDVPHLAFVWPRSFGGAGALRPLDDLIKRDGVGIKGWDDFFARDLAVGADGKTYGVPWTTDTFALMYNKDLFAQAGITSFPKSYEELRAASQTIHQKTGKAGWAFSGGTSGTPGIWFHLNFYWWAQGPGLIDRGADGKFVVGMTPALIKEGFDFYNRFFQEGHNPRANIAVAHWAAPELVEGMVSGNAAIISTPDPVAIEIIEKWKQRNPGKESPFATTPHPAGPNGSRTFFGGRMLGIAANSKNVEESWSLIKFLMQPDPTFTKHYTNYTLAQLSALATRGWLPELSGYPEQLKTARSWGPYGTGPVAIPFMWNAVGRAASSVFIGEKTSAQAAAELHDHVSKELAKNQK